MKLIYIQNARMPTEKAHGIQIMKMCESFARAANDVELVLPRRFNRIKNNPFDYYGIPEIFSIKKLPCLDLVVLDKYIGHLGLWIQSLTFAFSSLFYLLFRKADIIYTRDKFLLPLTFFKRNIVFEIHTFPKNYFFYRHFLKKTKGIVAIARSLKDSLRDKGISQSKILIAPDGVDIGMFDIQSSKSEAREKLGLPQDKKIVLYTGHLYEWKGVRTLAQTLVKALRYLPADAELYLVGGTEEDIKILKSQTSALNRIHVRGHRPYSEIPLWLKAADVLCLPNSGKEEISRRWTSPMKMFEYMAAQRPIVASNLPSLMEVLNKENAFLVEPDNAVALAQGIKELLQDFQLAEKIAARAFQDVQEYSWAKRVNKILEFAKS